MVISTNTVHGLLFQRRMNKNLALEPTPPNSKYNVNNRFPRCLTAEEVLDLFQSLKDEKRRSMWTMKLINLDLDLDLYLSWLIYLWGWASVTPIKTWTYKKMIQLMKPWMRYFLFSVQLTLLWYTTLCIFYYGCLINRYL